MKKSLGWSEDLGSKLKVLRLAHKVKQIDLARSLGISPAYLNLIENNKRPLNVDVLEKLLEFFAIDMETFLSASEGARLHNRFESILSDPYLKGHALGRREIDELARNSTLSNLIIALYDGFKNTQEALENLQRRLSNTELNREDKGAGDAANGELASQFSILDRTAYDEVTDFLEHHQNHFPALEEAAEKLLAEAGYEHGRRTSVLIDLLKRRFNIDVTVRSFPPGSHVLRLFNERTNHVYVSDSSGLHRMHFQLAHFIGLMVFEADSVVEDLIRDFPFRRKEAPKLARVNLANYFAGALLLPYQPFLRLVQRTAYDVRAMEGTLNMPFEAIAHRLCNLSRPGASGIPLHFIRTDIAGNISKKYSGTGLKIDDRRHSCPRWAVHQAFLTPSMLRRQYSVMPGGQAFFCSALATVQHDADSISNQHAYSVGFGCRAEDAHHMAYSRGLRFENPERDGVKVGTNCRVCDRTDCTQRALPSFKLEFDINTYNRKDNVLSPIDTEDLLLVAEEGNEPRPRKRNGPPA